MRNYMQLQLGPVVTQIGIAVPARKVARTVVGVARVAKSVVGLVDAGANVTPAQRIESFCHLD